MAAAEEVAVVEWLWWDVEGLRAVERGEER